MKTRKSIRAVFALLLAAVLLCGSLPVATAYNSDGEAVTLPDGGTYILTDYVDEGDFDVYFVNSTGTRLTTSATDSTVGVSIRGVEASLYRGTAGYLYIPDMYAGYPVVRLEKAETRNHFLGIRIPATVTEIADPTFSTCPYLEWIEVDGQNPYFYAVDGVLYKGNLNSEATHLVCYPQFKRDESFTTYPGAQYIDDKAFYGNAYLQTLTISVGQSMTVGPIRDCTALETLIFGEGPLALRSFSVQGCTNLQTVHVSEWFLHVWPDDLSPDFWRGDGAVGTLTLCCADHSAFLNSIAQSCEYNYTICADQHTYAQQEVPAIDQPPLPDDPTPDDPTPDIPVTSPDESLIWFIDYYQRDEQGNLVKDERGLPIRIGYAVNGLLKNYHGPANVTIPAYHDGLPVLGIDNLASSFDNLISVHIPSTVQSIKSYAFVSGHTITTFTVDDDSPYYKSVNGVLYTADGKTLVAYPQAKPDTVFTIPDGTERLADSEYVRLSQNIRQLSIPASFTDGRLGVKLWRTRPETILVDDANPVYTVDADSVLYNKDQTELLLYPQNGPEDYTLPLSVTSIAERAIGGNAPRTLRIADGATATPVADLTILWGIETLCLHIPASVTTIRLIADGNLNICSTTRASQAAAFAAANDIPFRICNEDHTELREPTDDDPPAPALITENTFDCYYVYASDAYGVTYPAGVGINGLLQTPDEPFVLTIPAEYRGLPVREVRFSPVWSVEHGKKLTKLELPATVELLDGISVLGTLNGGDDDFVNLAEITVDASSRYYCAVDGVLYDKAMSTLVLYPAAKADAAYAIPDGVRTLASSYVFNDNLYLQHLTIPASFTVGTINQGHFLNALYRQRNLQRITVDPENPEYASDDSGALYDAGFTELILYPPAAPAETFTIPASVKEIDSTKTFYMPKYLRVICIAEDAAQTPSGKINTTVPYLHIPSGVRKVNFTGISSYYQTVCSDSAESAAARFAANYGAQFALCSGDHSQFTVVEPEPGAFTFEYITHTDSNGFMTYTGVCITGLREVPDDPFTLAIPETYYGLPVCKLDVRNWPDELCSRITALELPLTLSEIIGLNTDTLSRCTNLSQITVNPSEYFSTRDGVLFNAAQTELIFYPPAAAAAIYTVPASVERFTNRYTFSTTKNLRVLCVAEGATQTPDGHIGTTGALEYVHIPSSVQNVRLTVNGAYQSICSDSANCAAAAYAQENSIPFALCSDAHTAFTPTQPDDLTDGEVDYYYMLAGNTVITGVCITGLKEVPDGPYTLTFPSTYADYPVLMIDFSDWSDEACSGLVGFHIPAPTVFVHLHDRFVNLRHITVDEENQLFCAQDDVLFNKISGGLVWYPRAKQDASYAIPDGVNHFRSFDAFLDNPYLKTLSFPASFSDESTISSMISRALYRLPNLQSISVDADNPYLMSDANGVLYNKDQTKLICYPCAAAAEVYTVPASVTHFESGYSIAGTKHLRVLCFADGVEQLPAVGVEELDGGFIYCRDLQYVHIPSSVLTIDDRYKTLRKSVTICSDSADSAAAAFAAEWGYKFAICNDDHTAFTEPDDPPVEPTAPIAMTVSGGTARPGETVQVTVDLTKNAGLVAARLHLTYDPSVLTLTGVQDGGLLETASFVAGKDLSAVPYTVLWEDALTHTNHTSTGTLVTYTFRVSENAEAGTTPVTLTYDEHSTYNVDLQSVACAITNANVTVVTRTPGDSNGDGVLDLKDVVLMRRFLAGGWDVTVETDNMDVNGDGTVSLKDSTLLSRFLAGGWNVTLQ